MDWQEPIWPEGGGQGADRDSKRIRFLAAALALMAVIYVLPTPPPLERGGKLIELTGPGKACIAVLAFAVVLWITEALPFAVTSLFVVLMIPLLGIADYRTVVRLGFGDPIITFFIGVLILSAAFGRSGLGARLVYHILLKVGDRTDRVVLGFLFVGAMLSMWITAMAAAAMLLPLATSILRDAGVKPLKSNFGRALMISCAWGPLFGGIATPAGAGPNPIAVSYLNRLAHIDISFVAWMSIGLPATLMMIPLGWLLLLRMFPPEMERLPVKATEIRKKLRDLGPLRQAEIKTLVIFLITVLLWLTGPAVKAMTRGAVTLPIQGVALFSGMALFLPGVSVLSWKEAEHDVDWGGILLIIAGLSLGMMVYETGAARWLAWILIGRIGSVHFVLRPLMIVAVVALLHLVFSSNTVTGTIIIPILIALAQDLGLDVWLISAPAVFTSSLAFILVTETPTNVIPYTSGYFSIRDMAKAGIFMTVIAALCVWVSILGIGTLTGAYR
ncbi:MAG: DASS family sodium-coupled anion symporter [Deltaproteobacteria bacterium]|nr:DASS family sodium-coupled anion symporter [Deltaproteobacteria bacterium]